MNRLRLSLPAIPSNLVLLIVAWIVASPGGVPPATAEPSASNAIPETAPPPGTRVRVTLLEARADGDSARSGQSRTLKAFLLPAEAAAAAVPPLHGERVTIDRSVIAEFETARRVPRAGRTTMIGAVVGVVFGSVLGLQQETYSIGLEEQDAGFAAAFAGGVLGAFIGLLFGLGEEDERWTAAPLPSAADSLIVLIPPKE